MPTSTGRNTTWENIWRIITGFVRSPVEGNQRSIVTTSIANPRNYDLEITENPVRDDRTARALIELCDHCPEVSTAIDILVGDVFSSEGGDEENGFKIADTLQDNETPVDKNIKKILDALIDRVIGGMVLEPAVERSLCYGDAFASIGVAKYSEGMGVARVLFLPTWEMFRIEDDKGILMGFEQRRHIGDKTPIKFHPVQIIHWRYRRKFLYGRSLFKESLTDWDDLKLGLDDLREGAHTVGINPTVHLMPEGADEKYKEAYRRDYQEKLRRGSITDFFLLNGADVRKLANLNPDLSALLNNALIRRQRIAMRSRVPIWHFPGLMPEAAKEISQQPSLSYSRHINRIRQTLAEGIKQICYIELTLKGVPIDKQLFRIVFPKIFTDPNQNDQNMMDDQENETQPQGRNGSRQKKQDPKSSSKPDALDVLPLLEMANGNL